MGGVIPGADTTILAPLRERIDAIDVALVDLFAERVRIVREVIDVKERHEIPARLPDRVEAVVARVRAHAEAKTCPPDLAEAVWRTVIEWTIAFEEQHMAHSTKPTK
ncbi:chorismate mutase [Lichenihabitans sp. PAMC28606]|uniref:chorismate mutase n=1 Tax=Lichenihabitans sp. PAMC28606 TaxID=2880932 RepID=UPI001D0BAC58|nr:chorismate mutase [Lichenihabitans sp. PAMC28606]UDL95294.1 chorismate mutase [Lichenihabitans sp. PAMC28606]